MDVPNEKIYIELLKIKKMLHESLNLQRDIANIEEEIKMFEGKQADEEAKLAASVKKKKFNSVFDWKNAVWDSCPHKKDKVSESTISFYCDISRGPCKFETCPRNIIGD